MSLRSWLRDWLPDKMHAEIARDFAKVGNDDHADLQRIGHRVIYAEPNRDKTHQWNDNDDQALEIKQEQARQSKVRQIRSVR